MTMASSTSALRQHASPGTASADPLPLGFVRDQATLQRTLTFLSRRLSVANLTQRQARTYTHNTCDNNAQHTPTHT